MDKKNKPTTKLTRWTPQERRYLTTHYKTMSAKQISEHIGRTPRTILTKANLLGLRKNSPTKPWTAKEIDMIRTKYPEWGPKKIAKITGRKKTAIIAKAAEMRIKYLYHYDYWSPDEIKFMKQYAAGKTKKELVEILGRSGDAIMNYAFRNGLHVKGTMKKNWNKDEIRRVLNNHKLMSYKELGAQFNTTAAAIKTLLRAQKVRIRK